MKKQVLSFVLVLCLLVGCFPLSALASTGGHTQAEAVAWANSQVGKSLDIDGAYGAQCVDFTCYYYQYLGQAIPWGNANQYLNGGAFCPSGWSYQNSPQAGDVAVSLVAPYGHVAIVTEIRGSQYVVVEQNYNYVQKVTTRLCNAGEFVKFIRPDFAAAVPAPISANFADNSKASTTTKSSIGATNATLASSLTVSGASLSQVGEVGMILYNYKGTELSSAREGTSVPASWSYLDIWYDVNNDLHYTLDPGTDYKYKFFAVTGGKTYYGVERSFKTSGTHTHKWNNGVCSTCGEKQPSDPPATENPVEMPAPVVSVKVENDIVTVSWTDVGADSYNIQFIEMADGHEMFTRIDKNVGKSLSYTTTLPYDGNYIVNIIPHYQSENVVGDEGYAYFPYPSNFPYPEDTETDDPDTPLDPTPENSFVDVPNGAYFAKAVNWAVEKGITSGTSRTTFSPNQPCTRAQAVTFLWRAAGSPEPKSSNSKFVDVENGKYYTKAVQWAVENGITGGTSANTFSPNGTCTRAQIVTFLYRMHGSPSTNGVSPFTDVPVSLYYANAVAWAVENGITSGTSSSTFSPHNDCSRGQIVTFLYRDLA